MSRVVNLDVLVVYSAGIAMSASVLDKQSKFPFLIDSKQSNYNLSYEYFLKKCKHLGISAGFTTSADIIAPGLCTNYWISEGSNWVKVHQNAHSNNIFDKISPSSPKRALERQLLLADDSIIPFNDPELFAVFFDKLFTYQRLGNYAIPTVLVPSSKTSDVKAALTSLKQLVKKHRYQNDFSTEFVLKDRYGAGGNLVYKIKDDAFRQISRIVKRNPDYVFILQPFLKFDRGYQYTGQRVSTDIRLIYLHDRLIQCYVRMAKSKSFLCNEHQGGRLEYVTKNDIPKNVFAAAERIVKKIGKPQALYALDFVVTNTGNVFFIEGNTGPGIDWDVTKKVNELKSKQLISLIVNELLDRINKSRLNSNVISVVSDLDYANSQTVSL